MAENTKRIRIILAGLENQGCTVKPTKAGYMILFPKGEGSVTIHRSESDHRAEKNTRARVIRAKLTWPLD